MPTIKDVARVAGVSLGTVSNVLNEKESVKPANREKVYKAIKQVGFHYNMTASSLRTKTTKNLGLIIPTITNPYYPELARGVEDEARISGMTVFLCNDDRDVKKERTYIEALLSKGVDGIIIVKPQLSWAELKAYNQRTSLVLVDAGEEAPAELNVVNVSDDGGVIQGMRLLHQYGHTNIGFISGLLESRSSKLRKSAYKRYLEDRNIPYRDDYLVIADYSWKGGYNAARHFLQLLNPPTAIFASNDIMALGAMKAALEKGMRIPRELSIIGFDNIEMCNLCTPSLTTIHQPKYEIGVESLRMLMKLINKEHESEDGMRITMETKLILRESVELLK